MDFDIDQLDIKKKIKAKIGKSIVLRLRFDLSDIDSSAVTTKGYAKVNSDEQAGLEMIDVETGNCDTCR